MDFAEELMADIPDDQRCLKFEDYVVENYISPESTFPRLCGQHNPQPR